MSAEIIDIARHRERAAALARAARVARQAVADGCGYAEIVGRIRRTAPVLPVWMLGPLVDGAISARARR